MHPCHSRERFQDHVIESSLFGGKGSWVACYDSSSDLISEHLNVHLFKMAYLHFLLWSHACPIFFRETGEGDLRLSNQKRYFKTLRLINSVNIPTNIVKFQGNLIVLQQREQQFNLTEEEQESSHINTEILRIGESQADQKLRQLSNR